jgi:hypothetical protein
VPQRRSGTYLKKKIQINIKIMGENNNSFYVFPPLCVPAPHISEKKPWLRLLFFFPFFLASLHSEGRKSVAFSSFG